ncbi:MAG: hypothetical protein HC805_06000 [Alkalinema sp. RL_2_19]|nr:hypothetical protein [Alkalinema sp. RL_2_19]
MQLFAERVLGYRLGKDQSQFQSYGFHEPNTDEGRQVYTIVDDQIYYFLPKLNADTIHRAFNNLQQLIRDDSFGFSPAIKQVVVVGESSTVDDREHIQEVVNNYQFSGQLSGPNLPPTSSDNAALTDSPEILGGAGPNPHQVTLLPSANTQPIAMRKALSYINEDPYWDPRQDDFSSSTDGILQDRASAITTWLRQQPQRHSQNPHPTQATHAPTPRHRPTIRSYRRASG